MTIPFICVLIAFLLIVLTRIPVGAAQGRAAGGYDNKNPRDQQAKLEGWGRRAQAAHLNTIEAFPPFAAAVIIAHIAGATPATSTALALTFIAARVVYPFLYIGNVAGLRSLVWIVGLGANIGLFVLPLFR